MTDVVDVQQLSAARLKFTELGDAIKDVSQRNDEMLDSLIGSLRGGFSATVQEIREGHDLKGGIKLMGGGEAYTANVAQKYDNLASKMDKSFDSMSKTVNASEKEFLKLSDATRGLVNTADAATVELSGKLTGERDADGDGSGADGKKKRPGVVSRLQKKEWSTFKSKIGGMMSKLKMPVPGAVAAAGIGIMIYGYKDKDRVRAEAGEMKNILIAAYDDGVKGAVDKGTRHLSAMQESLQKYMGINRKEIQGVAQAFVDGGISVTEMKRQLDIDLGKVRSSAVTTTLALDLMFNLAGGESAKRMVSLMADYGKTTDEARETLMRMYMVGRDSGIGAMQYVKNVEAAGSALAKMGFDIDNVIDIYSHVTERFEKMGVPKQFAGKQAALGIQQMASGVAKMSDSWMIILGQKLGHGRGLEARQGMMDAFVRVMEEKDTNEVLRIVEAVYDIAYEATGGNEDMMRLYMEKQMDQGFEGARLIATLGKNIKDGDLVKAAKGAEENLEILKRTWKTAAQKSSQFELTMNSWMKGLAKVGQGLLGMAIQTAAWLLAYFRTLPQFIVNALTPGNTDNSKLVASVNRLFGDMSAHKSKMSRGFDQMIRSMKRMGSDVLGGSLQMLQNAWDMPSTFGAIGQQPDEGGAGEDFSPTPSFGGGAGVGRPSAGQISQPTVPTTRVVQIPMAAIESGAPVSAQVSEPISEKQRGVWDGVWVGGGVTLTVDGVDPMGNVGFSIGGNCPRCGLLFEDAETREEEERRAKEREVEVINVNTGETASIDPTSTEGMEALSEMAVGGKARRRKKQTEALDPRLGEIIRKISEEFPEKRIKIFRGATEAGHRGQHSRGKALDIGVEGVEPADLFQFVQSKVKGGGKGFYPHQPFIHVDVRPGTAKWIDFSRKGEKGGETIGGTAATQWFKENVGPKAEPAMALKPQLAGSGQGSG